MNAEREEIYRKINAAVAEMRHAGPIHRKDLQRHVMRLMKQLHRCGANQGEGQMKGAKND